jgi:hypothetical protein
MLSVRSVLSLFSIAGLALGCASSGRESTTQAPAAAEPVAKSAPVPAEAAAAGETDAAETVMAETAAAETMADAAPAAAEPANLIKREPAKVASVSDDAPEPAYLSRDYVEVRTPRGAAQPFVFHTVAGAKANIILLRGGSGYVDLAKTRAA